MPLMRTTIVSALIALAATVTLAACGHQSAPASGAAARVTPRVVSAGRPATAMATPGMPMLGMPMIPDGGLTNSADGFTLALRTPVLPAGRPAVLRFQITADGKPVTRFEPDMTKLMHLYLIRSDLNSFQHVHPVMAPDGTWTVRLAAHAPGSYRIFTTFTAVHATGEPAAVVLSAPVTIPGAPATAPLPPPSSTATVDGYTLTIVGTVMADTQHTLTVTITKDGKPVTSLQPYLDSYAHLSAFRQGNLAFAHLHPEQAATSAHGGPELTFRTMFSQPGTYRMFLQFQTSGTLHTAAFTFPVS
jgi:hypothetical protein